MYVKLGTDYIHFELITVLFLEVTGTFMIAAAIMNIFHSNSEYKFSSQLKDQVRYEAKKEESWRTSYCASFFPTHFSLFAVSEGVGGY